MARFLSIFCITTVIIFLLILGISSCGGGGRGRTPIVSPIIELIGENFVPVFDTKPNLKAKVDSLYSYEASASDPDSGPSFLRISALSIPNWLTFTPLDGGKAKLEGTPKSADKGIHEVSLIASDGGASRIQNFSITVNE